MQSPWRVTNFIGIIIIIIILGKLTGLQTVQNV